ncbi:MAG: hypothetical protein KF760_05800 [Candidatus Eremiobacteraeota bacterium]|nr:hypothetical protein [Candidatus Eremiobacteraeota bacterium]MCW5867091.1 hypothetical protein [Candidatus Eremiobacteraeota bacterium]
MKLWLVLISLLLGWSLWQPDSSCCCRVISASSCSCGPQLCPCPPSDEERALNLALLPPIVLSSGTPVPQGPSLGVDPAADAYRSPRLASPDIPERRPRAPPPVLS